MVLEMLVQDWQTHGERSLALSLGAMTPEIALRADIGAYNQLFDQMCRTLDPVTRSVLDLAALLGHRMNDINMYSVADLAFGHTMRGLDQLTALRVLRDSTQGLEFVNELVRACAYHAVPSPVRKELHSRIADRLLAQDSRLRERCGLEIAWHCIRGSRLDQAVPYLLQGASAAIRAGAPHEAERALATGAPHFVGEQQVHAAALLAEALQERGDWAESIRVIRDILPIASGPDAEFLRVQMLFSEQNAQPATTWLGVEQLEELWRVMETSTEPRNQLQAASVAAHLSGLLMDAFAARRSYQLAQRIAQPTEEGELTLSCVKAVLANQCGDRKASLNHLRDAVDIIRRQGFANSTAVRVHTGLGVHAQSEGNYEDAIPHHMNAFRLAQALGNTVFIRMACLNLALCNARLGRSSASLEWTEKGMALLPSVFAGNNELQLLYWRALGHALLGQPDAAGEAIQFVEARLPVDVPGQLWRLWQLMKADVVSMLGNLTKATCFARTALRYDEDMTPLPHFLGLFARWAAVAAESPAEARSVVALTQALQPTLDTLAAVDAAEVLAASVMSLNRLGCECAQQVELLYTKLHQLPPAVYQQLKRLGVLCSDGFVSVSPEVRAPQA